ncbi:hypothetical protein [Luteibacter sp. UNCMF366Tsu5.1]|uniref:hypothetical protein n=1 Tax=Luteibacter sp. UNCMF366Tsu5.1 TaxID=1502758 RepID=UPI001160397C|nr:hypothetical protein [Luteibacter sp. UNCMF366Tsu5.1]
MAEEHSEREARIVNGELKVPFSSHNFSARCYDTLKCEVIYGRRYAAKFDKPSPPLTEAIRRSLDGSWGGIANFPPAARVSWVAKDGTPLEANVDVGEIFEDQYILYGPELDVSDVALDRHFPDPGIILVVDNRTISVYMRAMVFLRHPIVPSNPYSDMRHDVVLAFTRNF